MRTGPLTLLITTLLFAPWLAAEEQAVTTPNAAPASVTVSEQASPAPVEPDEDVQASRDGESALLGRLRQENQRLKLKLKEAQAQQPEKLLSEQQMWFAIGAGTALLAFIVGRLSAGSRNKRQSQWV